MAEEVTLLLREWGAGNRAAFDKLMPIIYNELRRLASNFLHKERSDSLQTTELVHEAFFKLTRKHSVDWQNRAHFFAIASKVMRRILLDYAKTRLRDKRGGGAVHVELDDAQHISLEKSNELVALDEALTRLAEIDELKSRIVEMRHFGGMSVEETAEALGIAPITVMRHWSLAKAWLRREITGE